MSTLWIIVALFVVVALVVGAVQMVAALGDRRHAREVRTDESRPHPRAGSEGPGPAGRPGPRSGGSDPAVSEPSVEE